MSAVPPTLDPKTAALARLQASRDRIVHDMRPGPDGRPLSWLDQPMRLLRRWWRRTRPAVVAADWLQTAAGHSVGDATAKAAALQGAGEAMLTNGRRWARQHPLASAGIAAVLGALLIRKRGALWGLALGVGQGVLRQGQGALLRWISDPALYGALIAALMARKPEPPEPPQQAHQPHQPPNEG